MANTLEVTVTEPRDENLKKFQKLLAYFVWHLEYINYLKEPQTNESIFKAFEGEQEFCGQKQRIEKISGQGYNKGTIQENIKEWELLKDGRVFISVQNGQKSKQGIYSTDGCYLHWAGIAGNVSIYAVWGKEPGVDGKFHITDLRVEDKWNNDKNNQKDLAKISLAELGIHVETNVNNKHYDSGSPSVTPKIGYFYDAFVQAAKLETKAVLEHAKNIIFTGAPGTGKTFLAKQIANLIGAETEFVQFHPSYDYTDFVEGLRPIKDKKGNIVFERRDGIFKSFCEKALKECKDAEQNNRVPEPYIFIIDEINRGEISKIFGELFFSVDPGYRGVSGAVKTQYANLQMTPNEFDIVLNSKDCGHFFIPENVYIIGTMNDIDRSVESMDFAFRRRFTFKEITAKNTQLQILNSMTKGNNKIDDLISKMDSLNDAISKSEEFSDAYHIGAAYFKHFEDYADQDNPFDKLWNNHIKGVLFEYLRGRPNAKEILKKWENAYNLVGGNKKGKKQEEAQEAIAKE